MHFLDPVAQAIQDHSPNDWMIGIDSISRSAVVGIAGAALFQNVIRIVIHAPKAQRRTGLATFRRVVVDDVENDFNASPM